VERSHAAEAVRDVFDAIEKIRVDALDPHDVPAARADVAVRLSLSLETLGQLVAFLSDAAVYGDKADVVFARWRAPQTVSVEEIHRVANRYLAPDKMQVVLVGDAAELAAGLGRDLGEIDVRQIR
jgi:predicted Zn-dependent peptidase